MIAHPYTACMHVRTCAHTHIYIYTVNKSKTKSFKKKMRWGRVWHIPENNKSNSDRSRWTQDVEVVKREEGRGHIAHVLQKMAKFCSQLDEQQLWKKMTIMLKSGARLFRSISHPNNWVKMLSWKIYSFLLLFCFGFWFFFVFRQRVSLCSCG